MANLPSVEKRNRQSQKRRARNSAVRTQVRGVLKTVRQTIEAAKPNDGTTKAALAQAMRAIGQAQSKGVIHHRTAARKISRLAKAAAKKA